MQMLEYNHYPKDGDLPEDGECVLCNCKNNLYKTLTYKYIPMYGDYKWVDEPLGTSYSLNYVNAWKYSDFDD